MESQSYEAMLREVEAIVAQLGKNEISLDDLVSRVERGFSLIKQMSSRLDQAKMQIHELKQAYDEGSVKVIPKND